MLIKFEYKDNEEREQIMNANSNLIWVAEENLFVGNVLVFSDTQPEEPQKIP